jgi:UDP-N-acetylmuramoylalanine--D-glutamate ligase
MRKDRIIGKKITVMGMARSGLACAKLLRRIGADVFVSEIKGKGALANQTDELEGLGMAFETGKHSPSVMRDRDFIVVSPGIPLDIPILSQAKEAGIPILSEIEVAFWLTDAKIIGITGSNGKTTTVTLVGEILREDGREYRIGGNIGIPFSSVAQKVSPDGYLVLELSSFQLERIEEFRPHISAVLNITPDHLDRHPDLQSYAEAKLRIMENQTEEDFAVLNADDENTLRLAQYARSRKVFFSLSGEVGQGCFVRDGKLFLRRNGEEKEILAANQIGIKGPHNLYNACAACAICGILKVTPESMRTALTNFRGVEHRLEEVKTVSGVSFVNDSKATNVESVWYALQSVKSPIILIAGGKDKGGDFSRLRELVKKNVKALILIGQAREKIKDALGSLVPTFDAISLQEAVQLSFKKASPQDTVMLSPGCASFDMFRDYEHRGEVFKTSVDSLG